MNEHRVHMREATPKNLPSHCFTARDSSLRNDRVNVRLLRSELNVAYFGWSNGPERMKSFPEARMVPGGRIQPERGAGQAWDINPFTAGLEAQNIHLFYNQISNKSPNELVRVINISAEYTPNYEKISPYLDFNHEYFWYPISTQLLSRLWF